MIPFRRSVAAVALGLLMAGSGLLQAPAAGAQPSGCVDVMPVSALEKGMTGVGYTTVEGSAPTTFDVEVLGVLTNGIAPGIDLIVVRASGPPIDLAGGIWFGASGSPVYIDGKLVGAVAYGFSAGSRLAGLTPAEAMLDVHGMPEGSASAALLDRADEEGGFAAQASPFGTYRPLRVPLGVSGLRADRLERIQDRADDAGLPYLLHSSASASPQTQASAAPPVAGGNFVGVLSYGDVTLGATGTTTYVCDGRAVAFGHPFTFRGPVSFGANDADAFGIVEDLVFGPYKLVQPTGAFGTLDQDRLAAVRALLGRFPALIPVTSDVTSDETGRSRPGRSDATDSDFVPDIAFIHMLSTLDAIVDRIGPGESTVTWKVTGTSPETGPWTLERENVYASQFDISFDSTLELLGQLAAIQANPFAEVSFGSVDVDASVRADFRQLTISRVLVRTPEGSYEETSEIFAEPGSQLDLRIELEPYRGTSTVQVDMSLHLPEDAAGAFGFLEIAGGGALGGDPSECLFDPQACAPDGRDLPSLIAALEDAPRNDDLVARLFFDPFLEPGEPEGPFVAQQIDGPDGPASESTRRLDRVVNGHVGLSVFVNDGGGGDGGVVDRLSGPSRVDTAIALSQATYPEGASAAVLARSDEYADALAGAPLAAQLQGPILLTKRSGLEAGVAAELERLGVRKVVLLGGTGALSEAVDGGVRALGIADVARVGGVNRFDTARRIAARFASDEVVVAKGAGREPGRAWPDAVSASAYAAQVGAPILLVEPGRLPAETRAALTRTDPEVATIVGGEGAVSVGVEEAVAGHVGSVRRAGGPSRFDTSVAVADLAVEAGADPFRTFVATGADYPDALAAGPAVAAAGGVLLLVHDVDLTLSPAVEEWIANIQGGYVTIVGGPNAVSGFVEQQMLELVTWGGEPVG